MAGPGLASSTSEFSDEAPGDYSGDEEPVRTGPAAVAGGSAPTERRGP